MPQMAPVGSPTRRLTCGNVVGPVGLEPTTYGLKVASAPYRRMPRPMRATMFMQVKAHAADRFDAGVSLLLTVHVRWFGRSSGRSRGASRSLEGRQRSIAAARWFQCRCRR